MADACIQTNERSLFPPNMQTIQKSIYPVCNNINKQLLMEMGVDRSSVLRVGCAHASGAVVSFSSQFLVLLISLLA